MTLIYDLDSIPTIYSNDAMKKIAPSLYDPLKVRQENLALTGSHLR